MSQKSPASRSDLLFVGLTASVVMLMVVWPTVDISLGGDHYFHLALSFSQGRLDVDQMSNLYRDFVPYNGHKYLPFGPLPGLLLAPFVAAFGAGIPLVFYGYALGPVNVYLFDRLLKRLGIDRERRLWLALLYFGGTPYLSITLSGISTFFAHVVTTTFLLLALVEFHGKRRYIVTGIFVGLAAATRMTALFSLPYFLWLSLRGDEASLKNHRSLPVVALALLLAGLAIPLSGVAWYNFARFGDATETGFGLALLYNSALEEARAAGLFSIAHVPKNLFEMLLAAPRPVGGENAPILRFPFITPSPWGMGIFFTSPALLYAFRSKPTDRRAQASLLAIGATLIPILSYYGIGFVQFGYRYALDFMPFLLVLVALATSSPLSRTARALISASVLINIWGAISLALWI